MTKKGESVVVGSFFKLFFFYKKIQKIHFFFEKTNVFEMVNMMRVFVCYSTKTGLQFLHHVKGILLISATVTVSLVVM